MLDLTFDPGADAIYVRLHADEGKAYRRLKTKRLDDFRNIDSDADGRPMGVEFLDVSRVGLNLEGVPEAGAIRNLLQVLQGVPVDTGGGWLAVARKRLGMTQAELGEALGVQGNTIARWERGDLAIGNEQMVFLAVEALTSRRRYDERPERAPRLRVAEE